MQTPQRATYPVSRFLSESQMKAHGLNENSTCSHSLWASDKSDYLNIDESVKRIKRLKTGKYVVLS